MTDHKYTIEVVEDIYLELGYSRPEPAINPQPSAPVRFARPLKVVVVAIALTILLHLILATGLFMDVGNWQHPYRDGQRLKTGTEAEPFTTVLLLEREESIQVPTNAPVNASAASTKQAAERPVDIQPVLRNDEVNSARSPDVQVSGQGIVRTPQMIYLDQIKARIDRLWNDTNPSGNRLAFGKCTVKVSQDSEGNVREVEFESCTALPTWKASLEHAIRQASPLPAPPPDAGAFVNELVFNF